MDPSGNEEGSHESGEPDNKSKTKPDQLVATSVSFFKVDMND